MSDSNTYFAALPPDEIGRELVSRVESFYTFLRSSGIFARIERSYFAYYGLPSSGQGGRSEGVTQGGAQGELTFIKVNHYRNIAKHLLQLTCSSRPAWSTMPANTDQRSLSQAILGDGLLEYYYRELNAERIFRAAAEYAIIAGDAFVTASWDATKGNPVQGMDIREGDVELENLFTTDVIRDCTQGDAVNPDWVIIRHFQSRYDVAARFPASREKVLLGSDRSSLEDCFLCSYQSTAAQDDTDDIPVFEFRHDKTPAMPEGRLVLFTSDDCILYDGPLPYRDINVHRINSSDLIGTPFGYSPMFDLLGLQESVDALYSVVISNQQALGVQNIMVPKGFEISVQQLTAGLNVIKYDGKLGEPKPLQLLATPPEIFAFIKQLEGAMETLSGVNSTVRGDPQASLKSGSALALVQAQAVQYTLDLQESYAQLVEDIGTSILKMLRDFAQTQRVAMLAGKANRYMLKEFTGDDLAQINRVVVERDDAANKTLAMRMETAKMLVANKLVNKPEEVLMVVRTGKLEPLVEGEQRELALIRSENEKLQNGEQCMAIMVDAHSLHIREHRCVLADPDVRNNPQATELVLAHINEHLNYLFFAPPPLLAMLGEQSFQMPPPSPEQAAGGTPPKDQHPGGSPTKPKQQVTAPNSPSPAPPQMPSLPTNPSTGNQWDPETGGEHLPPGQ